MAPPSKLFVTDLDTPPHPIQLHLIQLDKGPGGFEEKGRLKLSNVNNGKPFIVIVWVTTHPPCLKNLPQYELLAGLADQLESVNLIFLDYDPDRLKSEEMETLSKVFRDYYPPFPMYILDPQAPEAEHPRNQFESFIVPELIMLDPQRKATEHFVLNDRASFTKALTLISQPKSTNYH
ncbi:MAG: hypothetical protein A3I75_00280 [Deltaproteobacteria bacterium RIFCSPLOWO2_02_FULL_50_16]|nr:MAG: hypothetical protein A2053_04345 [Deltaproteobacteria bacterium GWA2_50_8]OGQ30552.1 MAG: hypothetical protein A3B79_05475 [Deltaproteobacteria bacterium RIFCSPHIGHO2_02_FULL_50_15]OGQ58484.1 MAG: hypothetical protein A3I75_00280 [Deltaproteobacteria bacterium RIFCSPLOWO2_02_FULL_50_16]OGQ67990.1 MAG: hypothetical protein A3F89_03700 [Deltaproteobacteria bacterium RIFCSPLOWO2_12_FULL_50_11]